VEVDGGDEVLFASETTSSVLDPLDFGIDELAGGVGDAEPQIGNYVSEAFDARGGSHSYSAGDLYRKCARFPAEPLDTGCAAGANPALSSGKRRGGRNAKREPYERAILS
jgi:hypothetical protein